MKIAESQLQVREKTGHNDAKEIDKYLLYVGLPKGLPYCLSFDIWCWGQVYKVNPFPKVGGTVHFMEVVKQHPLRYKVYTTYDVKRGKQMRAGIGIYFHDSRTGHAFLFDSVKDVTSFNTIEANTVGKATKNVQEQRGESKTNLKQGVHRRIRTMFKEGMSFKGVVVPK